MPSEIDDLARVGTVLELAAGHEAFEWFGRGPHETYPDRARGGRVGRWRSSVADQLVAYIRPQENGGHADTRWFRVAGPDGGIRVDLDTPGQVSATHSTAADLDAAAHDVELRPAPRRSSTSTPPTGAWGPRAAGPTRSRRTSWVAAPTAGPGPCAPRPPAGDDPLGRDRPRVAPGERPDELGDAGARERLARAPPRRRPAATRGLAAPPGPGALRGLHQSRRRAGGARGPGAGRRGLPRPGAGRRGPGRIDGARPPLRHAPHRRPASRSCRASRRRTPRPATRRRRSRSTSSTPRPVCS